MTAPVQSVKQAIESTPRAVDVMILAAGWLASFLQPIAILVTILWAGLQIYLAVEKRWFRKDRQDRHDGGK